MKLKSILYKKEQDELVDKIINVLELDDESSIISKHKIAFGTSKKRTRTRRSRSRKYYYATR